VVVAGGWVVGAGLVLAIITAALLVLMVLAEAFLAAQERLRARQGQPQTRGRRPA
jgi:hypothetical protein